MKEIAFACAADLKRWARNNARKVTITGSGFEGPLFVVHYRTNAPLTF